MTSQPAIQDRAALVMRRCLELGAVSEEAERLTRRYGTAAMRQVNELVAGWMRDAGMQTRRDAVGNLIGRYEGVEAGAKTLLLGSHLDTVRDACRYDGPLGVMVALGAVEQLQAYGVRLPFAVEVVGFADEEGLRYRTSYLGSRAFIGAFDASQLRRADEDGIMLIEQGPLLESLGAPVGVVTSIQGQSGVGVTFSGEAGHAGTVPMAMRRDALTAAAEFVLAVESVAQQTPGLVATVGRVQVTPGASNVIPGQAVLSLDTRHADDAVREDAVARLQDLAEGIARRRGTRLAWHAGASQATVACSQGLTATLSRAVSDVGEQPHTVASGAGHDAAIISQIAEIAMLFVRCAGGISHSPKESVMQDDVAVAIDVLDRFVSLLAADQASS
jgi:allantoate deiminase